MRTGCLQHCSPTKVPALQAKPVVFQRGDLSLSSCRNDCALSPTANQELVVKYPICGIRPRCYLCQLKLASSASTASLTTVANASFTRKFTQAQAWGKHKLGQAQAWSKHSLFARGFSFLSHKRFLFYYCFLTC